jgi:23S rRNA (cytidine2498-2'-O)-methyltransferase
VDLIALAARGFERPLQEEVGSRIVEQRERLFVLRGKEIPVWAQNVWLKPEVLNFKSISEAGKHLRGIQRNWWLHSLLAHRRGKLIQQTLPPFKPKPIEFLARLPEARLGAFTLFDENTLVYSSECTSRFADGEIEFLENKFDPPSRAYLKLWEYFTVSGRHPGPREKVIDLGSSPGGWTWVLDQLGCNVISVDKAPLAENLRLSERVKFIEESAFALKPQPVDWLFSDVICYPERLLELVKQWQGFAKNFVCTVKFQGPTNFAVIEEFLQIRGSKMIHLYNNKHELTWIMKTKD